MKKQVFFDELKVKLVQAYVFTVLFSYQKVVMGAFTLVQCVNIQDLTVLFIQGNVECYTWWQICIILYICTSVIPIFFVLANLPFCLKDSKMSVKVFLLACLFPLPAFIGHHVLKFWKRNQNATGLSDEGKNETVTLYDISFDKKTKDISSETCEKTISSGRSPEKAQKVDKETILTDNSIKIEAEKVASIADFTVEEARGMSNSAENVEMKEKEEDILAEVIINVKANNLAICEEAIAECLLKHYKCLRLFGIRFTWLGAHKIYRVALVACSTFITIPISRLYAMGALVMTMAVANAIIQPYKDQTANRTATLSYMANLCITGLSLVKVHLVAFGCDTSCQYRDTVVQYMNTFEDILLLYAPLAVIGLWVVNKGLQNCLKKCK